MAGVAPLRAEPFGASAVLVWCAADQTAAVAERARARWPDAADVVPAASSVLVDGIAEPVRACAEISSWIVEPGVALSGASVTLETRYDGPDLVDVARIWDVTVEEVVAIHTEQTYVVAFCGFAPGFAYCSGLPADRAVPRRSSPRPRVEPGSVALAGLYTGVYPSASPGGWQVIGRTEAALWDLGRDEPALLAPGTTVRFVAS